MGVHSDFFLKAGLGGWGAIGQNSLKWWPYRKKYRLMCQTLHTWRGAFLSPEWEQRRWQAIPKQRQMESTSQGYVWPARRGCSDSVIVGIVGKWWVRVLPNFRKYFRIPRGRVKQAGKMSTGKKISASLHSTVWQSCLNSRVQWWGPDNPLLPEHWCLWKGGGQVFHDDVCRICWKTRMPPEEPLGLELETGSKTSSWRISWVHSGRGRFCRWRWGR